MSVYDSMTINNDTRDLSDKNAVKFSEVQSLTSAQKSTARGNIGAPPANGSAPDLTAGFAENLVPPMTENTVPYNFRTSDGPADILGIMYDKLVGGTLAWNQLSTNPNFNSTTGWTTTGTFSVSNNTANISKETDSYFSLSHSSNSGFTAISGHKYLITGDFQCSTGKISLVPTGSASTAQFIFTGITTETRLSVIWIPNSDVACSMQVRFSVTTSGTTETVTGTARNYCCFDLTQMFGSAIADYVYGLEQATPGAGVAWFRKLFPKDYYAYDAGSLQSVQAASHNTVGFNQWDEEWELGGIADATGQNGNANDRIRSKNYIPCLPDTVYYFKLGGANWRIFYYDKDKDYISHTTSYNDNRQLTTPNNAYYMRFWKQVTTYSGGICINLSWSGYRNGEYEPYVKHSYALDDSLTLRGIPKLDAANNLYYDGDTYESDGTVTRRYEQRAYQSGDETLADAITDGTNTVVKLATPTTESADPFQSPQVVDDFGTEEYTDAGVIAETRDVAIPVGHVTQYPANLRDKLRHLPDLADGDGQYVIQQSGEQMILVPSRIPAAPTGNGTYVLRVTVSGGNAVYSWVSAT